MLDKKDGIQNCGYGCKVLGSYILLCVLAVILYFLLNGLFQEPDKPYQHSETLVAGLITWTAAMIVPVAAGFALTDWKTQQRAIHTANDAREIRKLCSDTFNPLLLILIDINSILEANKAAYTDYIEKKISIQKLNERLDTSKNRLDEKLQPITEHFNYSYLNLLQLQILDFDDLDFEVKKHHVQNLSDLKRNFIEKIMLIELYFNNILVNTQEKYIENANLEINLLFAKIDSEISSLISVTTQQKRGINSFFNNLYFFRI